MGSSPANRWPGTPPPTPMIQDNASGYMVVEVALNEHVGRCTVSKLLLVCPRTRTDTPKCRVMGVFLRHNSNRPCVVTDHASFVHIIVRVTADAVK
jgi:hypothetical protein